LPPCIWAFLSSLEEGAFLRNLLTYQPSALEE